MKHFLSSLILLFSVIGLSAQGRIGVEVGASANMPLESFEHFTPSLGMGGTIGILYQYQYNHFIAQTGLECNLASLRHRLDTVVLEDARYTKCLDQMMKLSGSIPIMVGLKYNYMYALVGAKVLLPYAFLSQKTQIERKRKEEDCYFDDLNQAYLDQEILSKRTNLPMNMETAVCFELGTQISFDKKNKTAYYASSLLQIGLYAELGLLNTSLKPLEEGQNLPDTKLSFAYMSQLDIPRNIKLSYIDFGIRATFFFRYDASKVNCNCLEY